jgi:hypothetical protein
LEEVTAEEANRVLRKTLTDPELLFRAWYRFGDRRNPLSDMFDPSGMALKLDQLVSAIAAAKQAASDYGRARRAYIAGLSKADLPQEIRALLPKPGPKPADVKSSLRMDILSTETNLDPKRAEVVWAYLETILEGAKFEPSDLVDLAHAMYLPLADLWRGDRRFSGALIRKNAPYADRIVVSLLELPDRISARLDSTR